MFIRTALMASHDVALLVLGVLLSGAAVAVRTAEQMRISLSKVAPAMLMELLESPELAGRSARQLSPRVLCLTVLEVRFF